MASFSSTSVAVFCPIVRQTKLGAMKPKACWRESATLGERIVPQAGRTAHYMLRWPNTHGEAAPWNETVNVSSEGVVKW